MYMEKHNAHRNWYHSELQESSVEILEYILMDSWGQLYCEIPCLMKVGLQRRHWNPVFLPVFISFSCPGSLWPTFTCDCHCSCCVDFSVFISSYSKTLWDEWKQMESKVVQFTAQALACSLGSSWTERLFPFFLALRCQRRVETHMPWKRNKRFQKWSGVSHIGIS